VVALTGALGSSELDAALTNAVARHEILRTTFVRQPGVRVPFQAIQDKLPPTLATLNLAGSSESERDDRIRRACSSELTEPFDFERGPLLRALLATLGDERHVLILTISALCADVASLVLLVRELAATLSGSEPDDEPLQYADFAAWQHELVGSGSEEAKAADKHWSRLASARSPELPSAGTASTPFIPDHVDVELPENAAGIGAKDLQAAWHVLLARASGEESVTIMFASPGRRHADLVGAIGAFAGEVPLTTRIEAGYPFAEVVRAVEQARGEAQTWQDYAPAGAIGGVSIGFIDYDAAGSSASGQTVVVESIVSSGQQARLLLSWGERPDAPLLRLYFDPECYTHAAVERLARQLTAILVAVSADPTVPVGEIDLLDEHERRRLLEWGANPAPTDEAFVQDLFASHATASPERDAVLDEHGSISYAELDARSNQLAHHLRACGIGPDVGVGLCTDRSIEMVIGLLGILKAGGAYVPLHFEHPPARLGHQLSSAGARAIVTQQALLPRLPEWSGAIVCLDGERDRAELESQPTTAPEVSVAPENLAYVIYTSGSTGTPKGVGVTHGNLVNYAIDIASRLGADAEPSTFGLVTAISTDLGNTSVFGALCSGGTLSLISPATAADGAAFAAALERTPIDVLKITPSHIGALLTGGDARVLPGRWLVIGGERAPWDLISSVRELSSCSILNHYGPTETTIGCCSFEIPADAIDPLPASVPIGRPMANATCYVLDEQLRLMPLGFRGRLFVGGAGVARGYVGQPELTAERFVPDPHATTPGALMYDTGDLVRFLPDGNLEFLGRSDEQVKLRGFRVEPAEVETALRSHPRVKESAVVTRSAGSGDARLLAYCTVTGPVDRDELRSHLSEWLPEFMLPSAIVVLDELPRTPSGKVDRLALPDPASVDESLSKEYVAPRTPVEGVVTRIWSETLGLDDISVNQDFFELGGHSLLAMQVVAKVRSDLAVDLPLHSLFTYPTVESLAAEIVTLMGESDEDETAKLVAELEGLSDAEAQQLLAGESSDSGVA
jgi:amino acid adenylation domain-containing protein